MKKLFTNKDLKEFDRLLRKTELKGFDNYNRNIGRLELNAFVEKHGKAKCDAMFEIIKNW